MNMVSVYVFKRFFASLKRYRKCNRSRDRRDENIRGIALSINKTIYKMTSHFEHKVFFFKLFNNIIFLLKVIKILCFRNIFLI